MATRTISNTGGNWGDASTWVEGIIPTNADDVVATVTSGNISVAANADANCKTLDLTNYTNTLTINGTDSTIWSFRLSVYGNITLGTSMTLAGGGCLCMRASGTLTSNGKTISGGFEVLGITCTLSGNAVVNGKYFATGGVLNKTSTETLSSNGIFYNGGNGSGTAKIIVTGGTIAGSTYLYAMKNDIDIAGNVQLGITTYNYFGYNTGTFKYVSGGLTFFNSTSFVYTGANTTWDTGSGMANIPELKIIGTQTLNSDLYVNTLTINGTSTFAGTGAVRSATDGAGGADWMITNLKNLTAGTTTLTNALTVTGTLTQEAVASVYNDQSITLLGDLITNGNGGSLTGTTTFNFNPPVSTTKTWAGSAPSALSQPTYLGLTTTFNGQGTLQMSANYAFAGTLTITSVILDTTTNNSTMWIVGASTLNANGFTFNRINSNPTSVSGQTITLSSNLQASMLNLFGFKTIFAGTGIFNIAGLKMFAYTNSNVELNLKSGLTYIITDSIEIFGSANYAPKITASTASSSAFLNFSGTRNQNIIYVDVTDIDSSGGNKIWYANGTMLRIVNWNQLSNKYLTPITTSSAFVL